MTIPNDIQATDEYWAGVDVGKAHADDEIASLRSALDEAAASQGRLAQAHEHEMKKVVARADAAEAQVADYAAQVAVAVGALSECGRYFAEHDRDEEDAAMFELVGQALSTLPARARTAAAVLEKAIAYHLSSFKAGPEADALCDATAAYIEAIGGLPAVAAHRGEAK